MRLPSPCQIKTEYPLRAPETIQLFRKTARDILERKDPRLVVICGPCSVHDLASTVEYAKRLHSLSKEIDQTFFLIMRVFFEKPRTHLGWKGLLYDPYLDGSHDIAEGIRQSRALILKVTEIGLPCASELLEPLLVPYFNDLITWGLIGARTSSSQPHRQMASGLPFPIGFKNNLAGDIEWAVTGVATAQRKHSHIGTDEQGYVSKIETQGNPLTHLVLRGSERSSNYDAGSINKALQTLSVHGLEARLMIDCSHGNSGKNPDMQKYAFEDVCHQRENNPAILGVMLESHLRGGRQSLNDREHLQFGLSITDPCMSWEETSSLLRSRSMSFVQK